MPGPYIAGTHILLAEEYACKHCGRLPPGFYLPPPDELEIALIYQVLFRGYEKIREERGGGPLGINSGYRCLKHAQDLYDAWVIGGKRGNEHAFCSTHNFGVALDLQGVSADDQANIVSIARELTPKPRIGWENYRTHGSFLVHIDYGHLIEPIYSPSLMAGVEW